MCSQGRTACYCPNKDNLFSKLGQAERVLGDDVYESERRYANIQRVPAECRRLPKTRERDQRILSEDGPAGNGRRVPHDGGRSQSAFYPEPPPPIQHGRGRVCWRNHEPGVQKIANRPHTIKETHSDGGRGPQGFVNATHVVIRGGSPSAPTTLAAGECLPKRARIVDQDCARRFSQAR